MTKYRVTIAAAPEQMRDGGSTQTYESLKEEKIWETTLMGVDEVALKRAVNEACCSVPVAAKRKHTRKAVAS